MSALNAPHFHDEDEARLHLEKLRWPEGPVCPHCGSVKTPYALKGKAHRRGLLKCADCREQFSVTVGTVFERSKIPLSKWLTAVYLMCSSKKGISSLQIQRTLGVTYKTAWFMTHRIREAMKDDGAGMLGGRGSSGIVEADETYMGKSRGSDRIARYREKQKVVALVERDGNVRAFHVQSVTAASLKPILEGNISPQARLMTDSAPLYGKIASGFKSHETVNHLANEYARGDVTTNTVEGYFGILKRGIGGIYQHVSAKHLHRYVNEFSFRYNNRSAVGIEDEDRTRNALAGIGGKRLTYRRTHEALATKEDLTK
jgi:transposase-like protein